MEDHYDIETGFKTGKFINFDSFAPLYAFFENTTVTFVRGSRTNEKSIGVKYFEIELTPEIVIRFIEEEKVVIYGGSIRIRKEPNVEKNPEVRLEIVPIPGTLADKEKRCHEYIEIDAQTLKEISGKKKEKYELFHLNSNSYYSFISAISRYTPETTPEDFEEFRSIRHYDFSQDVEFGKARLSKIQFEELSEFIRSKMAEFEAVNFPLKE